MPSIVAFDFEGTEVRTVVIDGEPQWVAADVAAVLELGNVHSSLALLDEDEKGLHTVETLGGRQALVTITEAGLYSLILRSRKPQARAFKRWVTHEVLPAIRRNGRYEVPALGDPLAELERQTHLTARAIDIAKSERARADAAERRAVELEPDAARARQTLDAQGLALVGTVAKRFGVKERALFAFLRDEGLLISGGSRRNEPYARLIASGHFEVKTRLVGSDPDRPPQERSTTYVTPKGEALIWRRLFDAGYVPSATPPARQLETA